MIPGLPGPKVAVRTSEPVLLLTLVLVLQNFSPGQNNARLETDGPSATLAHLARPPRTYRDGSIRDISAVGKRDIGCSQGLGRYSLAVQIDMGRSYARRVETTSTLVADPMVTEYMNRVTQNLVRNSDTQIPFAVKVINSDDVNAFSLPGGFLFVNSGLILATDDEAELAGAISHEVAHVAACHAAQEMAREELTNLAAMPLILRLVVRHITLNTSYFKIDRSFESEADFLGVEYMYKAGYDPQALSSFFEKLQNMGPHQPGERARAFEFHSQMADRIDKIQKEINALLPPLPQYKLDTSDFRAIKQRLSEVQNYEVDRNHGGKRIARDGPLPE